MCCDIHVFTQIDVEASYSFDRMAVCQLSGQMLKNLKMPNFHVTGLEKVVQLCGPLEVLI